MSDWNKTIQSDAFKALSDQPMTTTDPKLIERASLIAEQAYSAGNLVTCDGYYEFDLDAAAAVVAAAINEAAQKERVGILRWIERNGDRVASVSTACMGGDNLAVTLCSHFDNPDQETDDDTGWTEDAVDGCNEVIAAIVKFFADAIEAHKESQHG